jgi:hypothetical protein
MTRAEIEDFLIAMLNKVEGGDMNPLDLKIEIKALTDLLGGIDKQVAPLVAEEGRKWHNQPYKGFKIEYVDSGGRYAYDHIAEWSELKQKMKDIEKNAQMSLKALEKNQTMIDDGGAVIEPAIWKCTEPYIKLSKTKEGA